MKINWVFANDTFMDPAEDITALKSAGQFWGSWKTWHTCKTDNIICYSESEADKLIRKRFNQVANMLYLPVKCEDKFGVMPKVSYFHGEFSHDTINHDEIIALHLASASSDIVILYGFDWSTTNDPVDPAEKLKLDNYRNLVSEVIRSVPKVQWVVVDHVGKLFPELDGAENILMDTMKNVKLLLKS